MTRHVIVGGVAGGASAAARLRRLEEKAEIVLLEKGEHVSFANCGLPYHVGGAIPERDRLFLMTPESFKASLDVDVRVLREVLSVDPAAKTVEVRDVRSGSVERLSYDTLLLSPGAEPIRPPLPGIDDPRVMTVRNVPDIDRVKALVDAGRARRAVVVGGGFIGLEMAENLRERGLEVELVEALDQVLAPLDFEMAALVQRELRTHGVSVNLGDPLAGFETVGDALGVKLASGRILSCDFAVLSIGVRPDSRLAASAGLQLDARGHIVVDSEMRTSVPGIWAVGDAVASGSHLLDGKSWPVPLAGPANKQARVAAASMAGRPVRPWRGSIATAIAKVFDLAAASTGLSEKACRREGLPFRSVVLHPGSHAGYYPGALPLALKLVWNPESGRVLGAQAVGPDGVDKRIDVVAAMIGMGASIDDLAEFEQAYAPPFSGAKDGVNYAGFVARDIADGLTESVTWERFEQERAAGAFVLDVRTLEENALNAIPGSVCIPHTELRGRLAEVPRDRRVLVYCGVGIRGYLAERVLRQNGWPDVANLSGGLRVWEPAVEARNHPDSFRVASVAPKAAHATVQSGIEVSVDACGLQCPGPILKLRDAVDRAGEGQIVSIRSTDPGFARDVGSWCRMTGNELVDSGAGAGVWTARIRKAGAAPVQSGAHAGGVPSSDGATMVVFSNDLDRALASFVIANGAAASGKKVTLFFTFWGISVIRRAPDARLSKDLVSRMFDLMLPKSSHKLALSRMHFGGLGSRLMRWRMKSKAVDMLEEMIETARASGVRLVACQMSMDLMGVDPSELLEGVEVGGVANYLESAGGSAINLFI